MLHPRHTQLPYPYDTPTSVAAFHREWAARFGIAHLDHPNAVDLNLRDHGSEWSVKVTPQKSVGLPLLNLPDEVVSANRGSQWRRGATRH